MSSLSALLRETTLDDLTGLQHVTILRDTATVEQALKALASKRILSSPVVSVAAGVADAHIKWPQDKPLGTSAQLLGFIDVRDVLSSFLQELKDVDVQRMKMLQRMRLLEEKGQVFATRPIKDLAVFGGDGDFLHTSQKSRITLRDLVQNGLLHPQDRGTHHGTIPNEVVHRVAIHDHDNKITNIISQTDIVKFLYMNAAALGGLAQQTAQQLGWAGRDVASVSPETSAIEAMEHMHARRISALAVTDGAGKIIGNYSISEMRTIMAEHFGALALPVGEFLALEHGTEFLGYSRIQEEDVVSTSGHRFVTDRVARARPRTPGEEVGQALVVAPPSATLLEIMELIVTHRIHRVYIMDASEKPVGVVTCTDVLKAVTEAADSQEQPS